MINYWCCCCFNNWWQWCPCCYIYSFSFCFASLLVVPPPSVKKWHTSSVWKCTTPLYFLPPSSFPQYIVVKRTQQTINKHCTLWWNDSPYCISYSIPISLRSIIFEVNEMLTESRSWCVTTLTFIVMMYILSALCLCIFYVWVCVTPLYYVTGLLYHE